VASRTEVTDPTSGFGVVPAVLKPAELDALAAAVSAGASRSRAGARHLLREPVVAAVARNHRLVDIASGVLGATAIPFRATFFDKSRQANWLVVWHQDTALPMRHRHDKPGWGPWSRKAGILYAHAPASALARVVALRVHLDDSTAHNGPLRVLPGSHRLGVLTDAAMAELKSCVPAVDCVVDAGGLLVMRPLLVHSSSKSGTDAPRRVLHIEYAGSLVIEDGVELAIA
jgi:ectoine hydroxylase-related dioxygenase (phytanoyl-CoA dioxygenase family)